MSPNQLAFLALVIAIIVGFCVYYWGKRTAMAAVLIAAIVGLILQAIFLMFNLPDHPIVAAIQTAASGTDPLSLYKFPAWMGIIYTVIIIIVALVYAFRDKRLPAVLA